MSFLSKTLLPDPEAFIFVGVMPDLGVEIKSPSDTMAELRWKSAIYLENGTQLVWIINPMKRTAEVCRLDDDGQLAIQTIEPDGKLFGEDLLPGFELELRQLFSN